MDNIHILIPARKGSKGLPLKNRKLLPKLLESIPKSHLGHVQVSTDDEQIISYCRESNVKAFKRNASAATDTASVKMVVNDFLRRNKLNFNDTIAVLYPTYPERKWDDVMKAYEFMSHHKAKSLLCKQQVKSHPYLCMAENGVYGKQVIKHNLYRRQDYPNCFELSHYVCMFKVSEVNKLNNNLYNDETVFMPIDRVVDVDTHSDLEKYEYAVSIHPKVRKDTAPVKKQSKRPQGVDMESRRKPVTSSVPDKVKMRTTKATGLNLDRIKDDLRFGVSIIGNGNSLRKLDKDQETELNSLPMFRCNWFFEEGKTNLTKHVYAWFFMLNQNNIYDKFLNSKASAKYILTPRKQLPEFKNVTAYDYWEPFNKVDKIFEDHLKTRGKRKEKYLPTVGMQMLAISAVLQPRVINLAGFDFYTQVVNGKVKIAGSHSSNDDPYKDSGYGHCIKTDMKFVVYFARRTKHLYVKTFNNDLLDEILTYAWRNLDRTDDELINECVQIYHNTK